MIGQDFWSRRKAAVRAEAQSEAEAEATAQEHRHQAALEAKPDAELLAEVGLPPPEEAKSSDDVRAYLEATLPQRLKDRALRRLWRLNPVLANLDGLVEYGEDYTDATTVIDNLQTVYQVGRGILTETDDQAPQEIKNSAPRILDPTAPADLDYNELNIANEEQPGIFQHDDDIVTASGDHAKIYSKEDVNATHLSEVATFSGDKDQESDIMTPLSRRMRFYYGG